jgi:hypothetical protein
MLGRVGAGMTRAATRERERRKKADERAKESDQARTASLPIPHQSGTPSQQRLWPFREKGLQDQIQFLCGWGLTTGARLARRSMTRVARPGSAGAPGIVSRPFGAGPTHVLAWSSESIFSWPISPWISFLGQAFSVLV